MQIREYRQRSVGWVGGLKKFNTESCIIRVDRTVIPSTTLHTYRTNRHQSFQQGTIHSKSFNTKIMYCSLSQCIKRWCAVGTEILTQTRSELDQRTPTTGNAEAIPRERFNGRSSRTHNLAPKDSTAGRVPGTPPPQEGYVPNSLGERTSRTILPIGQTERDRTN